MKRNREKLTILKEVSLYLFTDWRSTLKFGSKNDTNLKDKFVIPSTTVIPAHVC